MLAQITLTNGITIPRKDYAEAIAQESKLETNRVYELIRLCETDGDMDEDSPREEYDLMERICEDVQRTQDILDGKVTVKELNLTVLPANEMTSQEIAIVEAARTTSLSNGYSSLAERFDFGPEMNQFKIKSGSIASPVDYGAAIGLGIDMARKGAWITGDAISALLAIGHENAIIQIAADARLNYSTISNQYRTALAVPPHKRALISPSVAQEIVTAKYSDDPKENDKKKTELLDEAIKEHWNCSEARSHSKMARGHDEPITSGTPKRKNPELEIDRLNCIINEVAALLDDGKVKEALKTLKQEIKSRK